MAPGPHSNSCGRCSQPSYRSKCSRTISFMVAVGLVCWILVPQENDTCQFRAGKGKVLRQRDLEDTAARVVILIPAPPSSRDDLVRTTWASDARNVLLVGSCGNCSYFTDYEVEEWASFPDKVLQMFQIAAAKFPQAEVFVRADMDTYVFYENLLRMLVRHKKAHGSWPDYMGSVYQFTNEHGGTIRYCSGGAGYVLSRRAVESFLNQSCCHGPFDLAYDDVIVGRCLSRGGILPLHSTGFLGDKVEDALRNWLEAPLYDNRVGDPSVPAALITTHGLKDPLMLRTVDVLSRARQQPDDID